MDELRAGLELATTEELQGLTAILFQRRFNPLDYVWGIPPEHVPSGDRQRWLERLDRRFRFLASDGITVLRQQTRQVSYRQILIQVCTHLKLSYDEHLSTIALEEEIFLHLLDVAYQKLPSSERLTLEKHFQKALTQSGWGQTSGLTSSEHSLRLILKGGSAIIMNSWLRPWVLRHVAGRVALHVARYQVAKHALASGGTALSGALKHRVMLQMARRGAAINLARYSAVKGAFAVLGPAMWAWFLADLGWRAIATNYGRILPVIFTIAQIRLLRSDIPEDAYYCEAM